jgi:class 3 adenylate cyclase
MVGLATRKAAESGEQPVLLALWDGRPGDAVGGTHSMVDFCLANGVRVRLMQDLMSGSAPETRDLTPPLLSASSAIRREGLADEPAQQICAVMFADAVGYSKLKERDIPKFMRQYLAAVMRAMSAHEIVPLVKNTWGDGLYLVFDSVREAGIFALDFRDAIATTNWKDLGLPHEVSVRIGLHAGPLYRIYDPVRGQWNYIGTHVTRAARIEPSTPRGDVYASLAFAALAAAERVTSFDCGLVGMIDMAKGYGEMPAFKVSRR